MNRGKFNGRVAQVAPSRGGLPASLAPLPLPMTPISQHPVCSIKLSPLSSPISLTARNAQVRQARGERS